MSKHTPEPWTVGHECTDAVFNVDRTERVATCHKPNAWDADDWSKPNAARIATCVNALAGIPDPVAELARLRAVEGAARALVGIVDLDVEPWDPSDEGSIAHCRHCHAPEYRPHRDDCAWRRDQAVRDRMRDALTDSTPDPRDARIAELEGALRPFAAYAETFTTMAPDGQRVAEWGTPRTPVLITVGDLRRARTTLRGDK